MTGLAGARVDKERDEEEEEEEEDVVVDDEEEEAAAAGVPSGRVTRVLTMSVTIHDG